LGASKGLTRRTAVEALPVQIELAASPGKRRNCGSNHVMLILVLESGG
jgi:hypothetical protein